MPITRVSRGAKTNEAKVQFLSRKVLLVIGGALMTGLFWLQGGWLPASVAKPAVSTTQKPGKYSLQNLFEALKKSFKVGRFSRSEPESPCLIGLPRSKDAESVPLVWNLNPRFFWVGEFQEVELLDNKQAELWKSSIALKEEGKRENQAGVIVSLSEKKALPLQSVVLPGSLKLMPETKYSLLFKSGPIDGVLVPFKTVNLEMSEQINRDLALQESKLKASQAKPEVVLQARAEYLYQKGLYLDSLQASYEANSINSQYQNDLQSLITDGCKPASQFTQGK